MPVLLHSKSYYSFMQSSLSIENIVVSAYNLGYKSICLSDYNSMYGTVDFINCCYDYGIKPIIGLEFNLVIDDNPSLFLTIAKNNDGLHELFKLSTYINCTNELVPLETFKEICKNTYNIMYTDEGSILEDNIIKFNNVINDLYIGLSQCESEYHKINNKKVKDIAIKHNIKTVALPKINMASKDDANLLKVIRAIDTKTKFNSDNLIINDKNYIISIDQFNELYDIEDINNTDLISDNINITKLSNLTSLPKFDNIHDISKHFTDLCHKGLYKRFNDNVDDKYLNRLNHEIEVIINAGYENYFLVVLDFLIFAKKQNIKFSIRGSAAASLVAYALGISNIDPMKYNLLFERFLNSERISLPDIDIDISVRSRQKLVDYLVNKYTINNTARINNITTYQSKQLLEDLAYVFDIDRADILRINNIIKNESITTIYQKDENLRRILNSSDALKDLYQYTQRLIGLPKQTQLHSSGIVISNKPLIDVLPLHKHDGMYVTQFDKDHIENLGLIKFDLLNLNVIDLIEDIINSIDINEIPLDDKLTYELFARGDTKGIFQFESNEVIRLLKRIKPKTFYDLIAINALNRPGPKSNIETYINNREHPYNIKYLDDSLKNILEESYGILLYQEQILLIVKQAANFTLAKADILRSAIKNKSIEQIKQLKHDFIIGAINNGYTEDKANTIYDAIEDFASYGFNKAHSVVYSLLAYKIAYLKANYPNQYYLTLFNMSKTLDSTTLLNAKSSIKLVKPCINNSDYTSNYNNDNIQLPLSIIKGIDDTLNNNIINERNTNGEYQNMMEFIIRMAKYKNIDKNKLINLIYAGAFDIFGSNRTTLIKNIDNHLNYLSVIKVEDRNTKEVKYDTSIAKYPVIVGYDDDIYYNANKEYSVLGFNIFYKPFLELKKKHNISASSIKDIKVIEGSVIGFGIICKYHKLRDKNGKDMCFIDVKDDTGIINLVIFAKYYKEIDSSILTEGNYIKFKGNNNLNNKCIIDEINLVERRID